MLSKFKKLSKVKKGLVILGIMVIGNTIIQSLLGIGVSSCECSEMSAYKSTGLYYDYSKWDNCVRRYGNATEMMVACANSNSSKTTNKFSDAMNAKAKERVREALKRDYGLTIKERTTRGKTMEEIANEKKEKIEEEKKRNKENRKWEILEEKLTPLVQKWAEENNFTIFETDISRRSGNVTTLFLPPMELYSNPLRVDILYKINEENVEIDSIVPRFGGVVKERYLEYIH